MESSMGGFSVPIHNRRPAMTSPTGMESTSPRSSPAASKGSPAARGEALQTRRMSILDGQFRAVVSEYPAAVELLVESKQSGDVYGTDIDREGLDSWDEFFRESRQVYAFLVEALEKAVPPPVGLTGLDPFGGDGSAAAAGGLTCHVWEDGRGIHVRARMQPQYAFMRPVVISLELSMVAHATTQQKFAIHLQTQAQMSQQLLTEQMVTFGREVDEQRLTFEQHVEEKVSTQRGLMLDQIAELESKRRSAEDQMERRLGVMFGRMDDMAPKKAVEEALIDLREHLTQAVEVAVQGIKEEFGRRLHQFKMELQDPNLLPKGVYYVHAKGAGGQHHYSSIPQGSPRLSSSRSPSSRNGTTIFRVWTSGNLTEDEMWHLLVSQLANRRQLSNLSVVSHNAHSVLPRKGLIEPETEKHIESFTRSGALGKKKLSSGSITPSGQLLCEFTFP